MDHHSRHIYQFRKEINGLYATLAGEKSDYRWIRLPSYLIAADAEILALLDAHTS